MLTNSKYTDVIAVYNKQNEIDVFKTRVFKKLYKKNKKVSDISLFAATYVVVKNEQLNSFFKALQHLHKIYLCEAIRKNTEYGDSFDYVVYSPIKSEDDLINIENILRSTSYVVESVRDNIINA